MATQDPPPRPRVPRQAIASQAAQIAKMVHVRPTPRPTAHVRHAPAPSTCAHKTTHPVPPPQAMAEWARQTETITGTIVQTEATTAATLRRVLAATQVAATTTEAATLAQVPATAAAQEAVTAAVAVAAVQVAATALEEVTAQAAAEEAQAAEEDKNHNPNNNSNQIKTTFAGAMRSSLFYTHKP